jgi:hypothetical protein
MIFSENRNPLFGIMLHAGGAVVRAAIDAPFAAVSSARTK